MPKFNMEYHVQCVHSRKSLEGIFPNNLPCTRQSRKAHGNILFCRGHVWAHGKLAILPCAIHVSCFFKSSHGKLSILPYARCVSCACRQADDKVLICGVCCICRVLDNLQTTNDQAHDKCSISCSDEMGSYILFANLTS